MKLQTQLDRDTAVVVLGHAPMLSPYFASLKDRGIEVEFHELIDERLIGIGRSHRRTIVVVGGGIDTGTKQQTILLQLQRRGCILVSADASVECIGGVALAPVLPWDDVAWFTVETHRRFAITAEGRVHFARRALNMETGREWFASALMLCPCTIDHGALSLGMSERGIARRMRQFGMTWHTLCDRLVLDVSAYRTREGRAKEAAAAIELGCASESALSRRLKRVDGAGWRRSPDLT